MYTFFTTMKCRIHQMSATKTNKKIVYYNIIKIIITEHVFWGNFIDFCIFKRNIKMIFYEFYIDFIKTKFHRLNCYCWCIFRKYPFWHVWRSWPHWAVRLLLTGILRHTPTALDVVSSRYVMTVFFFSPFFCFIIIIYLICSYFSTSAFKCRIINESIRLVVDVIFFILCIRVYWPLSFFSVFFNIRWIVICFHA